MDTAKVWAHIHAERASLMGTLAALPEAAWSRESVCPGWTVKDVAAHVIAHPQLGWRQLAGMTARNVGHGYNSMIFREVRRLGRSQTREQILDDFHKYDGSTRRVPTTTPVEPLVDALVHHQDILRALGLSHEMAPAAAAVAADRCLLLSFLMGSTQVKRSVRLVADDHEWSHGSGPEVRGPMQELLLVCAGRARVATDLTGDGLELLGDRSA
ncbi:MAG TPA: maleylpyruvate isomerase family mycothiol-dependent enzyme [Nocardioides sp.]|nr:maleylpyruvate isomerase family mycothiol-dependent enzyme [Nocardioides sp.]